MDDDVLTGVEKSIQDKHGYNFFSEAQRNDKMKKEERLETIHKRAYEYANSGRFSGWQEIEWKLRKEGLFEARDELDRPAMRSELDDLCRKARLSSEVKSRESDHAKEENTENGSFPR